jgi:hypothetical protein
MGSSTAAILLNVLALVQAGFEFKAIVDQVQAMESGGATPDAVAAYIKGLRDAALKDLSAVL